MIGTIDPNYREATVVGAGVSGLLAAYYLKNSGYDVTLIEADERVGGLIQTRQTPWGIAETGPHMILASPAVREICRKLNVSLAPVRENSKARYIWKSG